MERAGVHTGRTFSDKISASRSQGLQKLRLRPALIDNCRFLRKIAAITALPMPTNLTLEPKYFEALNRWQLYISPMLSSTGKPQRLFYRTKRAAETAAEVFEGRQKNFGLNLSELTPAAVMKFISLSSSIVLPMRTLSDKCEYCRVVVVQCANTSRFTRGWRSPQKSLPI